MASELFPNALPEGTRIGPVVLEKPIGQGAWGIVYEGTHDVFGRVAVKEYFPSTYASRESRGNVSSSAPQWQEAVRRGLERFGQESKALKSIRHENVVPVVDYVEQDGSAFLVMEFVEGQTLTAALEAGQFADPTSVIALGAALVDTLQAIHAKNILHRDIAPDNIMIRPDGSPVLIDFGGAAAAIASATRSTQNIIKDGYSPPEQYDTSANPAFPVGPWSDIYATAATLYRLASGREPAVSNARLLASGMKGGADPLTPLTTLQPAGYPQEWLSAVDSGLALLPKDRPQSAAQWRKLFETPHKRIGASRALVAAVVVSIIVALSALTALAAPEIHTLTGAAAKVIHDVIGSIVVAPPTPQPSSTPNKKSELAARDQAFWDEIKGSSNPDDYGEYLKEFGPNALYAGLARERRAYYEQLAEKSAGQSAQANNPAPPAMPGNAAPPALDGSSGAAKPHPSPSLSQNTPSPPSPTPRSTPTPPAPVITRFLVLKRGPNAVEIYYRTSNSTSVELQPIGLLLPGTSGVISQQVMSTTTFKLVAHSQSGATVTQTAPQIVIQPNSGGQISNQGPSQGYSSGQVSNQGSSRGYSGGPVSNQGSGQAYSSGQSSNQAYNQGSSGQQTNAAGSSMCPRTPVGTWRWWDGGTVVFMPNGAATNSAGSSGQWGPSGGGYSVHWQRWNSIDYFRISPDGRSMPGEYAGRAGTSYRLVPRCS